VSFGEARAVTRGGAATPAAPGSAPGPGGEPVGKHKGHRPQ